MRLRGDEEMNLFYYQALLCVIVIAVHMGGAVAAKQMQLSPFLEYSNWFVAGGYAAYLALVLLRALRVI